MTIDTILRIFSLIVFGLILAIVVVGGVIARRKEIERDPWYWGRVTFIGNFIGLLVLGATTGFLIISPTDGWVEIIAEVLAISLITTAVEVIAPQAYFRWRKKREE